MNSRSLSHTRRGPRQEIKSNFPTASATNQEAFLEPPLSSPREESGQHGNAAQHLPTARLRSPDVSTSAATPSTQLKFTAKLTDLPAELGFMVAAPLDIEAIVNLRHTSTYFLGLTNDLQLLRHCAREAGLGVVKDLTLPGSGEALWAKIVRVIILRRQYSIGPAALQSFRIGNYGVDDAYFSPDGRLVALRCFDDSIGIWNRGQSKFHVTFLKSSGSGLQKTEFSPDSRYLIGTFREGPAHVWDLAQT